MSLKPRKTKRSERPAPEEKLDATPERLARAAEAGQSAEREPGRARRLLDPFDVMRATRALAPHDPKLNDLRWLTGEALRRVHSRAGFDALRAVAPDRLGQTGFGPRSGLPASEIALHARDKMRAAQDKAGPAAWPILTRIILEGAGVHPEMAGKEALVYSAGQNPTHIVLGNPGTGNIVFVNQDEVRSGGAPLVVIVNKPRAFVCTTLYDRRYISISPGGLIWSR